MKLQKWNPMETTRWEPFREMEALQERMSRIFGLTPLRGNGGKEDLSASEWMPLVDVTEDDQEYLIKAGLPEVKKEDVKVTAENGVLRITGERKYEKETKTKKEHRMERSYGRFERSFALPEDASTAKVSAEFKDGMLKVHLPKDENAKPKAIEVKVK